MRSPAAIASEIRLLEAKLRALRDERRDVRSAVRQAVIDETCHRFDAGEKVVAIARSMKTSKEAVRGLLWRAGRTTKGRARTRGQIAKAMRPAEPTVGVSP